MTESSRMLDPLVLTKIANLPLRARIVVEGVLSGLHRSPHQGSSVEFVEHKEYSPGDELKHVDWKALARSNRYYVKQFEDETNLRCHIILDSSGSMDYGSGQVTKFDYAVTLAASLAYLMLKQMDAVGLVVFGGTSPRYVPARSRSAHLQALMEALSKARPRGKADIAATLRDFAERARRRSLVILISDLFDNPARVSEALRWFRHRKNEVIVFHVLDSAEIEFPFSGVTTFESLEDTRRVMCDPERIAEKYRREIRAFIENFKSRCVADRIDYCLFNTRSPLDVVLARYLAMREKLTWRSHPSSIPHT